MKKLLLVFVTLALSGLAHAEDKYYDSFRFGPRFEKGRGYEGVGLEFTTKSLYDFKNWYGQEVHHSIIFGINSFAVDNVNTSTASGKYTHESALNIFAGVRVLHTENNVFGDLAVTYVSPDKDLSKDSSTGGMVRFGYLFPFQGNKDKTSFFNVAAAYTFGIDKPDRAAGGAEPDLFNGLALSLGSDF
jgi:hypothetical protein